MEFGARPLKRIVQSQVETLLARKMIAGEVKDGDKIEVYYDKRIPGLNIRPKIEREEIPNLPQTPNEENAKPVTEDKANDSANAES